MEDWLHFTETFSVCVLAPDATGQPLLPLPFQRMWSNLRFATLHFFTASRKHATDLLARSEAASEALKRYGALLEQHIGLTACKYNLHLLACRYGFTNNPHPKPTSVTAVAWSENSKSSSLHSKKLIQRRSWKEPRPSVCLYETAK